MRAAAAGGLVVVLGGCPAEAETSTPDDTEATGSTTSTDPSTADTEPPAAWFQVGWGTTDFNQLEGTLPVLVGPQGLAMFSLPIRGAGFYNPPDPSFDNPDMPVMQAWVDIEGYELGPSGHFNEVVDYPALFYPSLDEPGTLEGPAVWMVLPDGVAPQEIAGRSAWLHAELVDRDGLVLVDEHQLVVGDPP